MSRAFLVYLSGFGAIIVAAVSLWAQGEYGAAWVVGNIGTPVYMLAALLYVAIWHSRSKWPNLRWHQRLCNVLTFTR